jgi:two-component system LytT family sensor kinase
MEKNNNNKRKAYFNTIMWILFIIVVANIMAFLFQGPELFSSFSYYVKYASIAYAYGFFFPWGNKLIGKYTESLDWSKNPKRANLISFLLLVGYGIIMSISIPYVFDRFVWGMSGKDVFYDVSVKAFMTIVLDLIVIYFYYSTFLVNHWIKSIEKNEELKRENLLAKYEALKNQVNPHFLFNSLNTLTGVVEQKPELATLFIKRLSDIYRYVLEQNDKEIVPIHEEMKFVENYIFLSKMRFGEGLIFNTHQTINQNYRVAPLGIQMLVENAIKHNIISDDMPLKIEVETEDGFIIVKNNLQRKKTTISGTEPLGLANLKHRYAYLSGASVEVIESDGKFNVKLPIIEP